MDNVNYYILSIQMLLEKQKITKNLVMEYKHFYLFDIIVGIDEA